MRLLAFLSLSALAFALAACDPPDPSEFHHALRADVVTGTRVTGALTPDNVISTTDTHALQQGMRNMGPGGVR